MSYDCLNPRILPRPGGRPARGGADHPHARLPAADDGGVVQFRWEARAGQYHARLPQQETRIICRIHAVKITLDAIHK